MSWPPQSQPPPFLIDVEGIDSELDESNQLNTRGRGLRVGYPSLTRATAADLASGFGSAFFPFADPGVVSLTNLIRLGRKDGVKINCGLELSYEHELNRDLIRDDRGAPDGNCIHKLIENRTENVQSDVVNFAIEARQRVGFDMLRQLGIGRKISTPPRSAIVGLNTAFADVNEALAEAWLHEADAPIDVVVDQSRSVTTCSGSCVAHTEDNLEETADVKLGVSTVQFQIVFGLVDGIPKLALVGHIGVTGFLGTPVSDPRANPAILPDTQILIFSGDFATINVPAFVPDGTTVSDQIGAGSFMGVALNSVTLQTVGGVGVSDFEEHTETGTFDPPRHLTCADGASFYEKKDQTGHMKLEASSVEVTDANV